MFTARYRTNTSPHVPWAPATMQRFPLMHYATSEVQNGNSVEWTL